MSEHRSVLITGASTGIGQACALQMDRLGWRVFAGVRREADAAALKAAASPNLEALILDVTRAGAGCRCDGAGDRPGGGGWLAWSGQ